MFTELKEQEKEQVQLLRSLCALLGFKVPDVATRAGIPQENVEAFMTGSTAVLSDTGFAQLFRLVGVSQDFKLQSDKVHFWEMKVSRYKNKSNLLPLANAREILGDHYAMMLKPRKNVTPILIRAQDARIVLFVKTPLFYGLNVADLGLTSGPFEGSAKISQLPEYYYNLLETRALRPKYFDLILDGTYVNESLDLLRLSALEHDVTISELVKYVTRNDRRNIHITEVAITHRNEAAEVDEESVLVTEEKDAVAPSSIIFPPFTQQRMAAGSNN